MICHTAVRKLKAQPGRRSMTSFDALFRKAEQLEEQGDLYGALECWRELANLEPNATVYSRLARAAWELDLLDEAESAFGLAIDCDSSLALAYAGLATLRMKKGDSSSAETLLGQALNYEEDASTHCLLGSVRLDLGKTEEARQSFQRALALDPQFDEAYYNLGVAYRDSDAREAEHLFRKALELDDDFAPAHRELGWLLLEGRDLDAAETHLRRARQADPESMWGRVYLANLCWQRGYLQEAREEFVSAVLLAQDLGCPRRWLANFLEAQGELQEAEKLYKEALSLEPDDPDTLACLAGVLFKEGNLLAAREFAEQALRIEPGNKVALRALKQVKGQNK
jgi:tetratricopeptide (TPR) repeat protein